MPVAVPIFSPRPFQEVPTSGATSGRCGADKPGLSRNVPQAVQPVAAEVKCQTVSDERDREEGDGREVAPPSAHNAFARPDHSRLKPDHLQHNAAVVFGSPEVYNSRPYAAKIIRIHAVPTLSIICALCQNFS